MRRFRIAAILIFCILIIAATVWLFSPTTSSILLGRSIVEHACLSDSNGNCLVMPGVTGVNLDNQTVQFPQAFTKDYYLIVMPFDREQQVLAVTWLPLFKELAAKYEALYYFNIAALPNLNPAIRFLVLSGMSASISDSGIRSQIALLFLDDQPGFLEALAIENTDAIQILVIDHQGVLFYRDSGEYDVQKAQLLQDFIASLQS